MKLSRRLLVLASAAALTLPMATQAQPKPIRLVVGFPPGGATDAITRAVADKLPGVLGQPVIVDNKPGVGGRIAADLVLGAPADGLTFMVAPNATPPVCRIMDFGKFKFEQAKMARQARKKQHVIQLKEVKFRPGIDEHDFETKVRHARRFLEEGNKVKVTLMFRGRQITHPELGQQVVARVAETLADLAKVETAAKLEGKQLTMILTPK